MAADGILIINKPRGKTSRWATNQVSRLLAEKKAGHLGTLDPLATGVLPVVLGRATRLVRFLESDEKIYLGTITLGAATDTQDGAGEVVFTGDYRHLDPAAISAAVATFQGEQSQVPPMHSALKKDGTPLYRLARRGIEVYRPPRRVEVFSILVESISLPEVVVRVRCTPGTYMRTLADDLGRRLGCGAHLSSLVRLANGPFTLEQAVDLTGLAPEQARGRLIPLSGCLPHYPAAELSRGQAFLIRDGASVEAVASGGEIIRPGLRYRLLYQDELVAVAEGVAQGDQVLLRPLRVLGRGGT